MKWNSYLECWPEDGSIIIQIDQPCEDFYIGDFTKHYHMGMRKFDYNGTTIEQMREYYSKYGLSDFWWCYAKDFAFPDKDINR